MSKKSRRRNKKILAALALAGGAAMAGRRKKASIADMDDAGIGVTRTSNLGGTDHFPVKAPAPYPDAILRGGVGVKHSPRRKWTWDQTMAPNRDIFYKHGGRVTGIAKRGFGRALMKGKK